MKESERQEDEKAYGPARRNPLLGAVGGALQAGETAWGPWPKS